MFECVCVRVCVPGLSLWESAVLISHGMRPMSPGGDVRTEVRADALPRGRRFTSCPSGTWLGQVQSGARGSDCLSVCIFGISQ